MRIGLFIPCFIDAFFPEFARSCYGASIPHESSGWGQN
jgi:hypothetical protein